MSKQADMFAAVFAFSTLFYASSALAQEVNDIAESIVTGSEELPGLVTAVAYALGLLLGVLGVLKLKDHVENPQQTPIRVGLIRLLIGGALFALPIVYEAAANTIGVSDLSFDNGSIANDVSAFIGNIGGALGIDFNGILESIRDSISDIPGLISALAYILGLVIAIQALLKLRDHVENPDQTSLKESVIRFLVAGALFSIPTIYNAMFDAVGGNGMGIIGNIGSIFSALGFTVSAYSQSACNPLGVIGGLIPGAGGQSLGQAICGIVVHAGAFPAFLSACAYIFGLVMGIWGIFKIRDHVLNPSQTPISEGVTRLLAGGAFFALPILVEVARNTLGTGPLLAASAIPTTGFNNGGGGGGLVGALAALADGDFVGALGALFGGGGCGGGGPLGLDGILVCFMGDVMGPIHIVLNFFTFCGGMILLMIGVSRLIKSAQEGARGPGGIGTIMTFVAGGALLSYNELMRAFSTSLAGSPVTATFATMDYNVCAGGGGCAEEDAAHATISAVLQFVIIVGLISFVRGIFIMRGVAEGNQQASIMAGITHMVGGAVAVNLGPILNAVQTSLGLTGFGITFT